MEGQFYTFPIYFWEASRWEKGKHLTQKPFLEAKIHCECFGFTIWQLFSDAKINQLQIALRIQHHLDLGSVVYCRLMDVGNDVLEESASMYLKCLQTCKVYAKCDRVWYLHVHYISFIFILWIYTCRLRKQEDGKIKTMIFQYSPENEHGT